MSAIARAVGHLDREGPVRVPKTAEVIADYFRKQIVRGELPEGAFLPPEGQLTVALGISRPTLREVFRILEVEGFLTIVRGSRTGARVGRPRVELVTRYSGYILQAEKVTVADVYEARFAIEPYVVRELAKKGSAPVVKALREETDRLRDLIEQKRLVDYIVGVVRFHETLVKAGSNKTLGFLNQMILDLEIRYQLEYCLESGKSFDEVRKSALFGIRSFEKLINLIEAKNVAGAESHWLLHLKNAHATWVPEKKGDKIVDAFDS